MGEMLSIPGHPSWARAPFPPAFNLLLLTPPSKTGRVFCKFSAAIDSQRLILIDLCPSSTTLSSLSINLTVPGQVEGGRERGARHALLPQRGTYALLLSSPPCRSPCIIQFFSLVGFQTIFELRFVCVCCRQVYVPVCVCAQDTKESSWDKPEELAWVRVKHDDSEL